MSTKLATWTTGRLESFRRITRRRKRWRVHSWHDWSQMQIDLAADLFQETGNLLDILAIFRCFTDGPHDWVTSADRLSVAEEYLKEHVSAVAATLIELGRKGLVAAAWTSG